MPPLAEKLSTTKPKATKKKDPPREIIHPTVYAQVHAEGCDEPALDMEMAKELLGWTEEGDEDKWEKDFHLIDRTGKKIRCVNNTNNRPIYSGNIQTLVQEVLNRRWHLNGEAIIVGKTGLILNGQHTLLSLIFAEQERTGDNKDHWKRIWKNEKVTIPRVIVFGVDESDEVVNTLDTAKPRSLTDVIFRSESFSKYKGSERKELSRLASFAIKFVWSRTGAGNDAYAPKQTHSESTEFLSRHEKILECVKHIWDEDSGSEKKISRYISPGTAAGMMFLMATTGTDQKQGYEKNQHQKYIDWSSMDKASDFWVMIANTDQDFAPIRHALGKLIDPDSGTGGSMAEKIAVFAKAWQCFGNGKMPTEALMKLNYTKDEEGNRKLAEFPNFGGIDLGDVEEEEGEVDVEDTAEEVDEPTEGDETTVESEEVDSEEYVPSPEEIKKATEEVKKKNMGKMKGGK